MKLIEKTLVFLPCRAGSKRIKNKNIKPFYGDNSLLEIKLKQLLKAGFKNIVVSTNCEKCIQITESYPQIFIDKRPERFCSDETTTDSLINYVIDKFDFEILIWTHVTSPFFNENDYLKALIQYEKTRKLGFDSLMSGKFHQTFTFDQDSKPLFNREVTKWPFTQTINPIFHVNSAIFICEKLLMQKYKDRVGSKPYLYDVSHIKNIDIDDEKDFSFAKEISNNFFK